MSRQADLEQFSAVLKSRYTAATRVFDLKRGDAGSSAIDRLFDTIIGQNPLRISNTDGPAIVGDQVHVIGTGAGGIFDGLQITARFLLRDAGPNSAPQRHLVLEAVTPQGDDGWFFARRFISPAASELYESLKAAPGSKLTLLSFASTDSMALKFEGTVIIRSQSFASSFGSLLAKDVLKGTVTGSIEFDEQFPGRLPKIDLNPPPPPAAEVLSIGPVKLTRPSLGVTTSISRDPNDGSLRLNASLKLHGSIAFDVADSPTIPVVAILSDANAAVVFSASVSDSILAGLDKLAAWAKVDEINQLGSVGAPPLSSLLKLQNVAVTVDPSNMRVTAITFGVESASAWQIVRNEKTNTSIGIEKVFVSVTAFPGGGLAKFGVQFGGELQIAGAMIDVISAIQYFPGPRSGPEVLVELRKDSALRLSSLLHFFGADERTGVPDLEVNHLFVDIAPPTRFNGSVGLKGSWPLAAPGLSIELNNLLLSLDYERGQNWGVGLEADVTIGGFRFDVAAEHPSGAAGWEFSGAVRSLGAIDLSAALQRLCTHFELPDTSLRLPEFGLDDLRVNFHTATKDLTFSFEGKLALDGVTAAITIHARFVRAGDSYNQNFAGRLAISSGTTDFFFDLVFDKQGRNRRFAASFEDRAGAEVTLGAIIRAVSDQEETVATALDGLKFMLKDAVFLYTATRKGVGTTTTTNKFLMATTIGAGISLSGLPLVGKFFHAEDNLSVMLTPLYASDDFSRDEIEEYRGLLAGGASALPAAKEGESADQAIPKGIHLQATAQLGLTPIELDLPLSVSSQGKIDGPAATAGGTPVPATPPADGGFKWVKVQKSFGPVSVSRFGVRFEKGAPSQLGFALDAGLSIGPVSISLDGLSVTSPLDTFQPKFGLNGLGLDLRLTPVEIGGAFLRIGENEFAGGAIIHFQQLTINAIGAYAERDGHASLFLYAVLDYPIGGPSFFYVTGLAAGFGVNRALVLPAIEQVQDFPLVRDAKAPAPLLPVRSPQSPQSMADAILKKLHSVQEFIPPSTGEYFLAAGIHFTSFKIIDSFVLLIIKFGKRLEIDLLGLSTAVIPPRTPGSESVPPVAEIGLAIKAVFLPEEGFLGVDAQLTPASYFLSHDCRLRGGFAFYCWFKDQKAPNGEAIAAGDFVLTVGGYHPEFRPPSYYPNPPRLGFDWKVSPELEVKGSAYFALTPHAVMAGGELQAIYKDDWLEAHFIAGANFLIAWKPYHYKASIYVQITASATFWFFGTQHITIDIGADLTIWGPPFAGIARVWLGPLSAKVKFGPDESAAPALNWSEFQTAFLPAEPVTVAVTSGLLKPSRGNGKTDFGVLDAPNVSLVVDSAIPLTTCEMLSPLPSTVNIRFGVAPMDVGLGDLETTLKVVVSRTGSTAGKALFRAAPSTKNFPVALWGGSHEPALNPGQRFIPDGLAGVILTPSHDPSLAGNRATRKISSITDPLATVNRAFQFEPGPSLRGKEVADVRAEIQSTLRAEAVASGRGRVLEALGFHGAESLTEIDGAVAEDFLLPPVIRLAADPEQGASR